MPRQTSRRHTTNRTSKITVKEEGKEFDNQGDPYPAVNSRSLRMSYRIARGEQGVLTFEPYKSALLPLWRFRTPAIARTSSSALWERFLDYDAHDDFVGADMTRKFIQMGMTRAKRYANHKGGKKYGADGKELEKSVDHKDKQEKEEASRIFKEVWERCREHEGYLKKKEIFTKEQKQWDKDQKTKRLQEERKKDIKDELQKERKKDTKEDIKQEEDDVEE